MPRTSGIPSTYCTHFREFLGQFPPSPELAKSFLARYADYNPYTLYRYAQSIIKAFIEAILGKIREAFSEKALGDELCHVFRNTKDYFDMREAAIHLKAKLGDTECATAEALLKLYLLQKVNRAFG